MGQEVEGALVQGRKRIKGRAHLEGDHLLFRSDAVREKVMLAKVRDVRTDGATLCLTHGDQTLQLELSPETATKWASKILNPPSRLDKLGVKEGMRVSIVGVDDARLAAEIEERGATIVRETSGGIDVLFFAAESARALDRLASLRERLNSAGAIWVVHRKGKEATLRDVEVFAAAKRVGLVDNKVASFSSTHTAERLVIPLALRGSTGDQQGKAKVKSNTAKRASSAPTKKR